VMAPTVRHPRPAPDDAARNTPAAGAHHRRTSGTRRRPLRPGSRPSAARPGRAAARAPSRRPGRWMICADVTRQRRRGSLDDGSLRDQQVLVQPRDGVRAAG
jgi:hypothetical protein